MSPPKLHFLTVLSLLALPCAAYSRCDFAEEVPSDWVTMIEIADLPAHIRAWDLKGCEVIAKYQKDTGVEESEIYTCDSLDEYNKQHPILREMQPGDEIGVFATPQSCYEDSSQPMYAGYVLYRNGKQAGFELKVGTHNKALKWDADSGVR